MKIRRKDLLVEASDLQSDAELAKHLRVHAIHPDDAQLSALLSRVERECSLQRELMGRFTAMVLLHDVMQRRIEFLTLIAFFLLETKNDRIDSCDALLTPHIFKLFTVVHSLARAIEGDADDGEQEFLFPIHADCDWDHISVREMIQARTPKANPHRTPWIEMCRSSLAILLVKLLKRRPFVKKFLPLSLSSACSAVHSRRWEVQYIAMGFIFAVLAEEHAELFHEQKLDASLGSEKKTSILANSGSSPSPLKRSASSKQTKTPVLRSLSTKKLNSNAPSAQRILDKRPATTKSCEELSRNGFLRSLSWILLHKHVLIRFLGAEILAMLGNLSNSPNKTTSKSSTNVLLSSCLEQGVLPLLDCVRRGVRVEHSQSLFPEDSVREVVDRFLCESTTALEKVPSLRLHALSILTHSGNQRLRINVLVSLFTLAFKSPVFGSLLHNGDNSTKTNSNPLAVKNDAATHFSIFLSALSSHGAQDIKEVLLLLLRMLCFQFGLVENPISRPREIMTQTYRYECDSVFSSTSASQGDQRLSLLMDRVHPVVFIEKKKTAALSGPTQRVKMVCPSLYIIKTHCAALGLEIENFHRLQLQEGLTVLSFRFPDKPFSSNALSFWEKELKSILNNHAVLDDSLFVKIEGEYTLWQELFSHMSDEFIRRSSLAKLSLDVLMALLRVATEHHMTALTEHYVEALVERISSVTILAVCQSIIYSRDNAVGLHWRLCIAALRFISTNWEHLKGKMSSSHLQSLIFELSSIMSALLLAGNNTIL